MATKHYDWSNGPAELQEHSLTKHEVLVGYLQRYFEQRTLNARGREKFRITLVDGFCGGGLYRLQGTGAEVLGSPLRMLKAVEESQYLINKGRTKPLLLDVQYVFVDNDIGAINFLRSTLIQHGYGGLIGNSVHLICDEFALAANNALALVKKHTPRASTALFFLDQYG